jgi:hypothetical protein
LLIEEARTNVALYSGALVIGTGWAGVTISTISGTGPDGNSAYEITESTTLQIQTAANTGSTTAAGGTSITIGTTYTGSIFLKQVTGSIDWVQITLGSGGFGASQYANINLSNGTIGNSSGGTARVEPFAGGWYRVSFTAAATSSSSTSLSVVVGFIQNTNGTTRLPSYSGSTANKLLAAMAQFEAGSFATSYIPTVASSVVRSADVCSITGANFTSFYNSTEGTLVSNSYSNGVGVNQNPIVSIESGISQILRIRHIGISNRVAVIVSGVGNSPSSGYDAVNTLYKVAVAASSTGADYAINGNQISDTFAGSSLVADNMKLAVQGAGLSNTVISSIRYYRKRLPVSKLQALTA